MRDPVFDAVERAGGDPPPATEGALDRGRALLIARADEEEATGNPIPPARWTRRRALGMGLAASAAAVAVAGAALVGRRSRGRAPTAAPPDGDAPFDVEIARDAFDHGEIDYDAFADTTAMAAASDAVVVGTVFRVRDARVPPPGDTAGVRWDTVLVELRVDRVASGTARWQVDGRILLEIQRPGATLEEQRSALPADTRIVAYIDAAQDFLDVPGDAVAFYRPVGIQAVTVQGADGGRLVRPLLGQTADADLDAALPGGTAIGY
ncbi:hypothetical protein [Clavibacter californiensis]|uniref:Uncharacterized protein n=1 Tax=Clavibacter californiensis TaxID=1401995 RepID=A0ABX9NDE5_9MICO|nr:hypothetical protein [Clavibacter californiensis]PPF55349.1 hypothetical protein C5C13_12420 [Clavibacter michiganensis]RII94473.1 hypothetical protein DZF98_01470 [Clavibacter californiensis]UKF79166.1 hypothetical protein FGD68_10165 [Clavibacter californiensis]